MFARNDANTCNVFPVVASCVTFLKNADSVLNDAIIEGGKSFSRSGTSSVFAGLALGDAITR